MGKESFWAMIFYTALFTTLICAYPAWMVWVAPSAMQCLMLAILGGGANGLLYCLLKSFSLVDASALAPFRCAVGSAAAPLRAHLLLPQVIAKQPIWEAAARRTKVGAGQRCTQLR